MIWWKIILFIILFCIMIGIDFFISIVIDNFIGGLFIGGTNLLIIVFLYRWLIEENDNIKNEDEYK